MSRSEESNDYHATVVRLNADWRIIICVAGLQWVLQQGYSARNHGGMRWRSRSFCRTSKALVRLSHKHARAIEPAAVAILAALPERIEDRVMIAAETMTNSARRTASGPIHAHRAAP
jgi:hypothetical protein